MDNNKMNKIMLVLGGTIAVVVVIAIVAVSLSMINKNKAETNNATQSNQQNSASSEAGTQAPTYDNSGLPDFYEQTLTDGNFYIIYADQNGDATYGTSGSTNTAKLIVESIPYHGDGTYTIGMYKTNESTVGELKGANVLCIDGIGLSDEFGDRKLSRENCSLTDVIIKVDNKEIQVDDEKVAISTDGDNVRIELYNMYGSTGGQDPAFNMSQLVWSESLEVTFTIKLL